MSQDHKQGAASGGGCSDDVPCEETFCDTKRRRLLGALAAGGLASLAGCIGAFDAPAQPSIRGERDVYWANFLRQDQQVEMRGSQTVLRAAEGAGIEIPYFCRAGFCGRCLSKIDGDANEVVNMAMNDFEPLVDEAVEDGFFLPCTSQPRADFSIQTHLDEEALDPYQPEEPPDEDEERLAYQIEYPQEVSLYVPTNRDILRVGEDAGLQLPNACREGFCGQCLSKADTDANEVIEHRLNEYDPLDEDAMAEGYFLTCTGQPRSSFSFETDKYNELE